MEQMKTFFSRYFFAGVLVVAGLVLFIITTMQYFEVARILSQYEDAEKQTMLPVLASFMLTVAGILYGLFLSDKLSEWSKTKNFWLVLNGSLVACVALFAFLNIHIVKESLDEIKYKEHRKYLVTNSLLDLQLAQQLYKRENKDFSTNQEELMRFLRSFKETQLTKIELKELPKELDTMGDTEQIKQGYMRYDTAYMSLLEKYFLSPMAQRERLIKKRPAFVLDSMFYAPLAKNNQEQPMAFLFKHDTVKDIIMDRKTVVFEILDPKPLRGSKPDTLKIGSLFETTANGNWSEK
jgi:hypothetical protein